MNSSVEKEYLPGTLLTLLSLWFLWSIIPPFIEWAFFNSIWTAGNRQECWDQMSSPGIGACWAFIENRLSLFTYGFYPGHLHWRVNLTFVLLPLALTLILGVTGISFSLPIGIILALGRQSNMPVLRILCVLFIEFIRGVPLITLLFVASTMLNYFLPPGTVFDLLLRVLIMVTLFASAYMAEVIRGGLQAITKGQHEAGDSLGLTYWQANRLIVLPQALKISIPGIVNTFIGLYKDTTLVLIIGMLDMLGIGDAS